jgi:hypothetical protein
MARSRGLGDVYKRQEYGIVQKVYWLEIMLESQLMLVIRMGC